MSGLGGFTPLPLRLGGSSAEGLAAAQHARLCADLAAVSRTLAFAWVTFTVSGSPAVATVLSYGGMTGVGLVYRPLITTISSTSFNVVWNATQHDAYEVFEPLAIHHAKASLHGTVAGSASCDWKMGESNVTVSFFNGSGSAAFVGTKATLRIT